MDPNGSTSARSTTDPLTPSDPNVEETITALMERLRREPALRAWMLSAPTGALASLGIALDDHEIVDLLDQVEAMEERELPVTAADVMTPDPVTVEPGATVHRAAEILAENRISGLVVCGADRTIAGMLSEYDLIARRGTLVADIMSRDVTSVADAATLDVVRATMIGQRLKRVPVVDRNGHLVGIISRADLVRELAYRWACKRCGNVVRSRRPPEGCTRCGYGGTFEAAPPPPPAAACPTCGQTLPV